MKRIFVLYVVLSICAAAFSQIKFPEIKWKSDSLIFIRKKRHCATVLKHLAMAFMWIRSFIIWIQYVMWNPK